MSALHTKRHNYQPEADRPTDRPIDHSPTSWVHKKKTFFGVAPFPSSNMHVLSPLTSLCMVYRPAHSFSRLYDDRSRLSAVYNRHPTLVSDTPPRDPRRRRISVSARRKTIVQYSSVALDKLLAIRRSNELPKS